MTTLQRNQKQDPGRSSKKLPCLTHWMVWKEVSSPTLFCSPVPSFYSLTRLSPQQAVHWALLPDVSTPPCPRLPLHCGRQGASQEAATHQWQLCNVPKCYDKLLGIYSRVQCCFFKMQSLSCSTPPTQVFWMGPCNEDAVGWWTKGLSLFEMCHVTETSFNSGSVLKLTGNKVPSNDPVYLTPLLLHSSWNGMSLWPQDLAVS